MRLLLISTTKVLYANANECVALASTTYFSKAFNSASISLILAYTLIGDIIFYSLYLSDNKMDLVQIPTISDTLILKFA